MARSANRIRSLQRTCELVHDLAFQPYPRVVQASHPTAVTNAITATEPPKSHREWLEERFRQAVQKEFTRLGIK